MKNQTFAFIEQELLESLPVLQKKESNNGNGLKQGQWTQGDVYKRQVVSYIGYASQEIRLEDTKLLRIMMKEDVELLDEVGIVNDLTRCTSFP